MKIISKFKIYFSIIAILAISTSCSDWLEPKSISDFTGENAFTSYNGLKTGTVMLDRDIRFLDYYPDDESKVPLFFCEMTFSDLAVNGITDKAVATQDYNTQITPSSDLTARGYEKATVFAYWKELYKGIKDANTIINRAASVEMTDNQRDEILSTAYFHRAWRYYRLVHQFGDVPLYTEEIGSPRYDFYSTKREYTLRAMKADLESSVEGMPVAVNFGAVSQGAVYHLLTKINLALAEFDDAVASASKVIDGGYHQLMTQRFGTTAADAQKNVIWDLHRPDNKSIITNKEALYSVIDKFGSTAQTKRGTESMRLNLPWYTVAGEVKTPDGANGFVDENKEGENPYMLQYGRGIGTFRPTWYHQNTIWHHDNTDLRHDRKSGNWVSMEDLTYNNPALKTAGNKWYGKNLKKGESLVKDTIRSWFDWPHYKVFVLDEKANTWRGGHSDWYVFRLAETYLLRAEAYCWLDQKDKAVEDVNKVRIRANALPLTASQITIREILDERARELYLEEPRKTELTRIAYIYAKTGKVADNGQTYSLSNFSEKNFWYDQIMNATTFYSKGLTTVAGGGNNPYTISPYHVLWPISEAEIAVYSEGHVNQNVGYPGSETNIEPIEDSNDLK